MEASARILDMSDAAMCAAIRAMPDGVYEFTNLLDDDGLDIGQQQQRVHG